MRIIWKYGALILLGLPSLALASEHGSGSGYHMMAGGWGWMAMIIGPIMMIAVLVAVVAVVVLIVRWLGGGYPSAPGAAPQSGKIALDILKERYAKGEIDKDEFEERRRVLGD